MKYTIFVPCKKSISNYMLLDLKNKHKATIRYLYRTRFESIMRLKTLHRLIWGVYWRVKRYILLNAIILRSKINPFTLVVTNEILFYLSEEHLIRLRRNHIRIILLMIDPISASYPSVQNAKKLIENFKFDRVLSFDPKDAKDNNWIYCNTLYSEILSPQSFDGIVKYDLCYLGNIKNRFKFIKSILNQTEENQVSVYMKLAGCKEKEKEELPKDVILEKYLEYEQIVKLATESNCILDITQEGQTGVTFRYYEAVVYNRKLLTNNKSIVNMPFYDEKYMKIYNSVEEIDWDWVKETTSICYGYQGEFSPIHLLQKLGEF